MDRSSSRQPDHQASGHGSDTSSSSIPPLNMAAESVDSESIDSGSTAINSTAETHSIAINSSEGAQSSPVMSDQDVSRATDLNLEVNRLQEQLQQCHQKAKTEREDFQVKLEDLESQLSVRHKLNDRQRGDIEALQEQVEQQQLEVARVNRQWEEKYEQLKTDLVEERDIAQKRVEATQRFKAELSLSRTSVVEAQTELSALKQEYERERDRWAEERESLHARLAGYSETEAESLQRWQEERETRDRQEATYQEQITTLQQELTDLQRELTTWKESSETAKSEMETLQQQLADQQESGAKQSELLDTITKLEAQAQDLESQNQQLSEYLQQEQTSLEEAKARVTELETLRNQQSNSDEAVAELRSQLQKSDKEIANWKRKFASIQMQHLRLKTALESHQKTVEPPVIAPMDEDIANSSVALKPKGRELQPEVVEANTNGADLPKFLRQP